MNVRNGFTKIDALVTITCLVLLAVNIPVISAGGRGRAEIDVCKANLMQLMAAWHIYADENADKIPGTYTTRQTCTSINAGVYPPMNCATNPPTPVPPNPVHGSFPSWVEQPHVWNTALDPALGSKSEPHRYDQWPSGGTSINSPFTDNDWKHAIACGTLFKYIKDFKIYACPVGEKGHWVTYAGTDAANGIANTNGWCNEDINPGNPPNQNLSKRYRSQFKNPSERIVFLDRGKHGQSWHIRNNAIASDLINGCWFEAPPVRHGNGVTLNFVDGHVEYHKWTDRAIDVFNNHWSMTENMGSCPPQSIYNCDKDLFYMAKIICGHVGPWPSANPFTPPPGCSLE